MTTWSSSEINTSMGDDNNKSSDNREDIEIIFGPDLNSDLPHEILGVPRYDPSSFHQEDRNNKKKKQPKPQRSTSVVVNTGSADSNIVGGGGGKTETRVGEEQEQEEEGYECYDVDANTTSSEENDYEALVERAYRDLARKYHPKKNTTSKKKTAVVSSASTSASTVNASKTRSSTNGNSQPTDKRRKKKAAISSTSLWAGGDQNHDLEKDTNDGEDDYEHNQLNTTMVSASDGSAATAVVVSHEDMNNSYSAGSHENNISIETIDSQERQMAFLKITRAYAALKGCIISPNESYDSLGDGDGEGHHLGRGGDDGINTSRYNSMETTMMSIISHEDAQNVYESKYGPYRDMYYSEAGMIGIPYAADLKEMWAQGGETITASPFSSSSALPLPSESSSAPSKPLRDRLSLTISSSSSKNVNGENTVVRRLNFFRVILLKKDMNLCLCISEILLTWTVIAFCVMAVLVHRNPEIWPAGAKNEGQIINIVGGVSLMIAQFIVTFWYGFTQYPAGGKFLDWLFGRTTKKRTVEEQDMEEIRDVCSETLHFDKDQRFSPWIPALCFPVVVVDQTVTFIASLVMRLFLAIFRVRNTGVVSYSLAVSKTVSALAIVVGYYCCWMYGNVYCKVVGAAALLMSQKMHTAMLFKMGLFEFVQTIVFGNYVLLTTSKSRGNKRRQAAKTNDIEDNMGEDGGFSADGKEEAEVASQDPSSQMPTPVHSALRPNPKYSIPKESPQVDNSGNSDESNPKSSGDEASYDGSLEMSYVEKSRTVEIEESFDGKAMDRTRSDTGESVGTGAAEILEDLNASSLDADEGSEDIVAKHKAAKRRLEETFSSTRPRVSFADRTDEMSKNRSFDISLSSAYSAGTDNLKGELIRPLESSRQDKDDGGNDEDLDESVDQDSFMLMKTIEIFQDDDPSAYNTRSFDSLSTFEERKVDGRTRSIEQTSSVQNFWNRSSTWTCGATAGPSLAFAGGSSQSFNKLFQRTGTSQSSVSRQRTSDTISRASRASASSAIEGTASSRTPTITMRAAPASNDDSEKDEFVVENIRIVSLLSHGADDNVGDYDRGEEEDELDV